MDFITKLPQSQGFDSVLTITDHDCTKVALFIPCNEEITGEEMATLYAKHVFAKYGLPSKLITDRDPHFTSKFTRELCRILGIDQNISTAYHPRTDGQSECTNQWLEQYLRFWVNERQDDWALLLPLAEFVHNNWTNETTRESPFHTLMGYHPRADWTDKPSAIPQVTGCLNQLQEARRKAQELMKKAQESWVKHRDTPKYSVGDQVWLEGHHLCTNQPTAKLAPRRHGPFKVIQVMSPVNYRLSLPTQWSIHDVFHTDLLTPYRETPMHGPNYQRPPPELIDGVEEYEVEKVLDSRRYGRGRKLQYLVKWAGYPDSDNQWVNKEDISADNAIKEFQRTNPGRETHIKASEVYCSEHSPTRASLHTEAHTLRIVYMQDFDAAPTSVYWSDAPASADVDWDNAPTNAKVLAWAETGEPTPTDDRGGASLPIPSPPAEEAVVVHYEGHQCWACNNNIDDNTCFAIDSPTVITSDEEVDEEAAARDVEEGTTHFPMPAPGRLSEDSSGGPPVLEGNDGGVGGGSIEEGEGGMASTSQLQLSAGNTPYPIVISLGSEYGGSEHDDDHTNCTDCNSARAYCHCKPLM
jgi:transposase InsO family protein